MAWPGLSFREQLQRIGQTLVDEFDAVLAQFVGYLSVQHKSDGTHSAITATTITTSGDATVGGELTTAGNLHVTPSAVADAQSASAFVLGNVAPGGGVDAEGLVWPAKTGERSAYGVTVEDNGAAGASQWSLRHRLAANFVIVLLKPLAAGIASGWALKPDPTTNGTDGVDLGENTNNHRWRSVFAEAVYANFSGFFERGRTIALGEWIAVTYAAGNFTASTGTWTVDAGDQITYAYTLIGKTMHLAFYIDTTDVSAAAAHLRLAIPGGFTAARQIHQPFQAIDAAGAAVTGLARVVAAGTFVELYSTMNAGAWTITAADNTAVRGMLTFEVQ